MSMDRLPPQNEEEQPTSHPRPESSTLPPTRETLNRFHKADLQKRCRELGLTKIWVNKDQLIIMILENSPPHHTPDPTQSATPFDDEPLHSDLALAWHTSCLTPMTSVTNTTPPRDESLLSGGLSQSARTGPINNAPGITQQTLGEASAGNEQPPCEGRVRLPLSEASPLNHEFDITSLTQVEAPQDLSLQETHQQTIDATDDDRRSPPDADGSPPRTQHQSPADQLPPSAAIRRSTGDNNESPFSPQPLGSGDRKERRLLKIEKDLETVLSKLAIKDSEIELLNTEVKTVYSIIDTLMKRMVKLCNKC